MNFPYRVDLPVDDGRHCEQLEEDTDRPTVGTPAHGDGQAGPHPHHQVEAGEDDVGEERHPQHPDKNETVDGVELHRKLVTCSAPSSGNYIYI